jgi:hypothetical protein
VTAVLRGVASAAAVTAAAALAGALTVPPGLRP